MNTNPYAKRILIFGDSNVWGDIPLQVGTRLPANVRWTGVLQNMLGNDYEVIEEGLIGRTTNVDDPFPGFEDKNGKDYLFPCLRSQIPLDYVILLLGSNDFKKVFNRTAKDVAKGIDELLTLTEKYAERDGVKAKILLISPTYIKPKIEEVKPHFSGSPEKSLELGKELEQKHQCGFINLAEFIEPSDLDSIHLEPESHKIVAQKVFEFLKKSRNKHEAKR